MVKLTRSRRIVLTVLLSAMFVPVMTPLSLWCLSSGLALDRLWD